MGYNETPEEASARINALFRSLPKGAGEAIANANATGCERLEFKAVLNEIDSMEEPFVQAHINSISFPSDIEGLENYVYNHGHYNIEDILAYDGSGWTVPRSCKVGDVVLWFHAKTAISKITALITQVKNLPEDTAHDKDLLLVWLEHARNLHKQYGGKVFAVGRIVSAPERWDIPDGDAYHFNGRIYADVGDIVLLEEPVDISEFNSFIAVSRHSAITPLPAKEFCQLRDIIWGKNDNLPPYFLNCEIGDFNLSNINRHNFLEITQQYRRRFLYEAEFRSYYVDYLLKGIANRRYYRECVCHATGKSPCFVDNVFKFGDRYFLLEVKLNIQLEKDLPGQLRQYINADYLYLKKGETLPVSDFERRFMYVIDTNAFYKYDAATDTITELIKLDDVHNIDDIAKLL